MKTEQKQCFAPSVLLVIMLLYNKCHLKIFTTWAGMAVRCQFSVLV